jgi:hypothetical protein
MEPEALKECATAKNLEDRWIVILWNSLDQLEVKVSVQCMGICDGLKKINSRNVQLIGFIWWYNIKINEFAKWSLKLSKCVTAKNLENKWIEILWNSLVQLDNIL